MYRLFPTAVFVLIILSAAFLRAQAPETAEQQAKKAKELEEKVVTLLDKSLADVNSLRLPQNRALVNAMIGDLFWKFDQNRARQLFRESAAELVIVAQQGDREMEENEGVYRLLFGMSSQQRTEILSLIAKRDAELALELLTQTRPAKLTEAILKYTPSKPGTAMNVDMSRQAVTAELNLEQRFALLAADENPELAIKLIKESLAKGISPNVLPLLEKIQKKDEKKASELAADVVKKIADMDLTKSLEDLTSVSGLLTSSSKLAGAAGKKAVFTDAQLKEIATKLANAYSQPGASYTMMNSLSGIMPALEKYVPERVATLKQKQAQDLNSLPADLKALQQRSKFWAPMTTPEEIIAELPKYSDIEKLSAYQILQSKIAEIDDESRAKKLIDQIPDEKLKTSLRETFELSQISAKARSGKIEDARKSIAAMTKRKAKVQGLVKLAMEVHKSGKEKDIEIARDLMKEARSLVPEAIETNDDMNDVMEVVRGYTTIDPDAAFKLFDPVIDQINAHVGASAVLSRFSPEYASFKKGEMVMRMSADSWESPLFRFLPHMQGLGKADFDRMNLLTDRFDRSDTRTVARLFVLQGVVAEEKKAEPAKAAQPKQ